MKKVKIFVIVILAILISVNICFADTTDISTNYVGTNSHSELFSINNNGLSTMNVALLPLSSSSIDEVKVTLVIKNASGTKVYNRSYNMPWNNLYGRYKLIKEYQLSNKGVYSFQATYKCYKNESLLEIIKSRNILKSY